jgi:hypothetical protein
MGRFFLHPCRVIAEACGVSKRTIHRWIRFHGLPVFHLPGGALCTTLTFLNDWARDRMEEEAKRPRGGIATRLAQKAEPKWRVRLAVARGPEGKDQREREARPPRAAPQEPPQADTKKEPLGGGETDTDTSTAMNRPIEANCSQSAKPSLFQDDSAAARTG